MSSVRVWSAAGAALALSLVGSAVRAQELSGLGAAHVYGQPQSQIATQPGDAEVMAAWPEKAKAKGLGGSAVMHCLADPSGALTDCQVMLERNHAGFGAALLSLAPKYRLKPVRGGKRTDGTDVVISATWPAPDVPVDWQKQPRKGEFSVSTTTAAWRAGGEGLAVMNCLVAQLGAMHDCVVVYQSPPGKGYGSMALRFQGLLRLKPAMLDGKPIAASADFIFPFEPLKPGEVP